MVLLSFWELWWVLILTENEGFSPEFIYEAPKGLRLKKIWILKILKTKGRDLSRPLLRQPLLLLVPLTSKPTKQST
jgi:hypothetical protein